jgi:alpha-beta hydrolase superfamily lysophospholipase
VTRDDEPITQVWVQRPAEAIAALTAARNAERHKIDLARAILLPLAGRDRTVDAALEALDGVVRKPLVWE